MGSLKVGGERSRKRKHLELWSSLFPLLPPSQDGLKKLKGDSGEGDTHTEKLGRREKVWEVGGFCVFGLFVCLRVFVWFFFLSLRMTEETTNTREEHKERNEREKRVLLVSKLQAAAMRSLV